MPLLIAATHHPDTHTSGVPRGQYCTSVTGWSGVNNDAEGAMADDIMDCDDTFSDDKRPLACGERSGRRVSLASPDLCVEISVSSLCNPG